MNFKKFLFASAMIAMALVACEPNNGLVDGNDDDNDNKIEDPDTTATADYITVSGAVEGTWAAGSKIKVNGHINVPEGKSLTIAEGVEVIFDERGVAANHVPVEFTVDGALFIHGTDEKPVLLSVDEASAPKPTSLPACGAV